MAASKLGISRCELHIRNVKTKPFQKVSYMNSVITDNGKYETEI